MEYIWLAPGFVRDVINACEGWEGREAMPMKLKELMMVLEIELSKRYKEYRPQTVEVQKVPELRDTKLKQFGVR